MPIYFSLEENKFYNSNFLKGVSGFDFSDGDKFYSVSDNDYKNILLQNYKNNLNYNFVGGETGFSFSPKSLTFSTKEEKMAHFSNLMKKYVNFRRCFLGYPKDIEAYISSGETSWANDAQSFINWKSDVEKKTNELIRDFILGLTSNEPSFSRIVTSNDFPRLRSYNDSYSRDSFFLNKVPNKFRDDNNITLLRQGDGPTPDNCIIVDPDPQVISTIKNYGLFTIKDNFLINEHDVGEAIGTTHYNTTMESHLNDFLNNTINFNDLVENILFTGNSSVVKYPILPLIETSPSGLTTDVLGMFVPLVTADSNNDVVVVGGKTVILNGFDPISYGSTGFWEQVQDEYFNPLVLNTILNSCCTGPATENFYDKEENKCGILSSCIDCNSRSVTEIIVEGPFICWGQSVGNETPNTSDGVDLRKCCPRRYQILRDSRQTLKKSQETFSKSNFSCNITQDTYTGSPCCPISEFTGIQKKSCPVYIDGEAIYDGLSGPCDCCWDREVISYSKNSAAIRKQIIEYKETTNFEVPLCWIIGITIEFYCDSVNEEKFARDCGCTSCPCENIACPGIGITCQSEPPVGWPGQSIDDADRIL